MRHAEIKQDKEQDLETSDRSLGNGLIGRLFTNHPRSVGETYLEHLGFAMGVAGGLFLAGADITAATGVFVHVNVATDDQRPLAIGAATRAKCAALMIEDQ